MDAPQHETQQPATAEPLRPSIPLIVVSILNMIVGMVAASVSLVMLELLWPHSLSYTSLLMFAWALITIIGQYLGTFRGNFQGASFSASGSVICCMLLYFSFVFSQFFTTDFMNKSNSELWGSRSPYVWIGIGLWGIISLGFNIWWAKKIQKRSGKQGREVPWTPISISLKEILALCLVLGIIMVPATLRAHANPSTYRADVAASDAPIPVPESAQAITYERNREGLLLVSFEIEEAPFRQWLSRTESQATQHGARWHELDLPLDATSPSPNRLPWSLSYGNEIVRDGFRVIWQAGGLHHVVIYDRDAEIVYYQQIFIRE